MATLPLALLAALGMLQGPSAPAGKGETLPLDAGYTAKIREYTTEPFFLTELVDHLPAHPTIPTPEKVLGYIIGTPKVLTYSADCARYLRELAKASPRIQVLSMGKSEEGREMVVAVISDEANMARLERLKEINGLLGDPRRLGHGAQAEQLVDALLQEGLPMYWATGGMHSPETGPPEMVLELAYRLVVSESPFVQTIRKNSVVLLTPVLEVDGRDRVVDINRYRNANPGKTIPLVYWGKYVAHDNNRDGMVLSLALSKAIMKTWFEFHPTVFHDLHESVPYLYISTGTGPYNAWLDPITINEWQMMAYHEINEMTKRGVPGVWTHDFFDGWAPHYGFYAANGHNAVGRFYETFSGGWADTGIRSVGRQTARDWFRPNPPFPRVRWSIRNNTNLMQSALMMGMHKVASEKDVFLRNYYLKSKRSVAKARTEGPAAYLVPADERNRGNLEMLLGILRAQGVEVHNLTEDVETADGKFGKGSVVIRMDQPYSRMADMMLDTQYYKPDDPRSYDDTGWTVGPLFNVKTVRCKDVKILDAGMSDWEAGAADPSGFNHQLTYAIEPRPDVSLAQLRFGHPRAKFEVADAAFQSGGQSFSAGTILASGLGPESFPHLVRLNAMGVPPLQVPNGRPVPAPRIAIVHTWTSTQDEGWFRIAFDQLKIPFHYVSVHELRDTKNLRAKYDCIVLPPSGGSAQSIVNGIPMEGDPIPWKASTAYPNLGGPDSTDDIRGGIELSGMVNLQKFLQDGGVLVAVGNMVRVPIDYGLVSGVSIAESDVNAPGGVYLAEVVAKNHPVTMGYGETLGVYTNANRIPLLSVGGGPAMGGGRGNPPATGSRASGRGSLNDPDVIQGRPPYTPKELPGDVPQGGGIQQPQGPRPTVLLRFATADKVLISGMIDKPEELAGRPAVVHCPVGKGSVVLFGINPMWRCETVGSYMLLFNAAMLLPAR
jgi:hypothetical protein